MKKIWTAFGCFVAGGVILLAAYILGAGLASLVIDPRDPGSATTAIIVMGLCVFVGWIGAVFFGLLGISYVVSAGVIDGQSAVVEELRHLRYALEDGGRAGALAADDGLAEMQPAHAANDDSALDALASLTDTGHQPVAAPPAPPAPPTPQPAATATKPPPVKVKVLKFNCIKCEAHLAAPIEHAGKRAKCKKCGEVNDVPIG